MDATLHRCSTPTIKGGTGGSQTESRRCASLASRSIRGWSIRETAKVSCTCLPLEVATVEHIHPSNPQRILALTGPAGTAKTSTLRVLSRELDFEILEWRNSMSERGPSAFANEEPRPDGKRDPRNLIGTGTLRSFQI